MTIMMTLGDFQFSINTAAYDQLRSNSSYTWSSKERVGQYAAKQFTGYGEESKTLSGVIYPEYFGDRTQIDKMRDIAAKGEPLLLVSGLGDVFGRWCIESIEENGEIFAQSGVPRKQSFTLSISFFDDGETADTLDDLDDLGKLIVVCF